jgi:hypothetical protein
MKNQGFSVALLLGLSLVSASAATQQNDTPSLTTDDVVRTRDSVTNANAAANAEAAARAAAAKPDATLGPAADGYARFKAESGYSFERPDGWKRVENLESKGAPSYFKYDAVFQDPKSGAVISAVSVDRSQLDSPIDISDTKSVNTLLATMLNPANKKDAVKIFRQVTGQTQSGARYLRIKAQGNGLAVDGSVVDTTFWVEVAQSDARLALVAVGYPSAKQKEVSEAAFHTVRTLEMEDGAGPAAAPTVDTARKPDAGKAKRKKNSAGGMRQQ